jgi:hypothetical protein
MSLKKVFLYGEFQNSKPFTEVNWRKTNAMLNDVPGLLTKTWFSGLKNFTTGGLYEFDSVEHALAYAQGSFAELGRLSGSAATVRLFDGDIVEEASRAMRSPYYR